MFNSAALKTFNELGFLNVKNQGAYFSQLFASLAETKATLRNLGASGSTLIDSRLVGIDNGVNIVIDMLNKVQINNKKVMVVGNGGSAGIAMHTLADYANAGGFKTVDFYGPALITCLSNDYGYENVFAKSIEMFAEAGDMLFAISSSGKSPNILMAAEMAKNRNCKVITFSGFEDNNPLRIMGDLNFYIPSTHYGFVELSHQMLIHCILDLFVRNKVYDGMRQSIG